MISATRSRLGRAAAALAALALCALALSACDSGHHGLSIVEGEPVELGELEYKVLFTRLLNIHDVEDRDYLTGQEPPQPGRSYLGVFVQIESTADEGFNEIPTDIHIVDSDEQEFEAVESESIFAVELGGELGPGDQVPALDSAAQTGPIEGSLILFDLPDEATENRPLELIIPGPDGDGRVELDI